MKKSLKQSTLKSTMNRNNIKDGILNTIHNSKKPLSTSEIGVILNRSWHTIIRYCLDLENEGKLIKFGVGRISIWQKNK